MEPAKGSTIAAVERAADVLSMFAGTKAQSLGVTEISEHLGMSKAVVHRILSTLRSRDYVKIDNASRRYSLGPAAFTLGLAYLDSIDVRALAREKLTELSAATGETATLSVRSGWTRSYIDQVTPEREVKMSVELGKAFPLHAGASSKAFLAFVTEDEREAYLAQTHLPALTDRTVTDPATLRAELAAVHRRGYATSVGERQVSAASVAAPILNHEGAPIAVISVCGPAERFRDELRGATDLLLHATRSISGQMGADWLELPEPV